MTRDTVLVCKYADSYDRQSNMQNFRLLTEVEYRKPVILKRIGSTIKEF